ncbi:MAG: hypothetical protein HC915_07125 [Anaerolineae bacterium]|nr:hypothetical protein [Anaerolineae bacterium]
MAVVLLWTLIAFWSGALPFSAWIARLALGRDIRTVGDGNPGATNVLKAGGLKWGALAFAADYLKAALPVSGAYFFVGITDHGIVPVAIAPVVGHAFSPLLRGQGGKALAATFGIWTGLTVGVVPPMLGILMGTLFAVLSVHGWAVTLALALTGVFITTYYRAEPFTLVWALNLALIAFKHRADLRQPLRLRARRTGGRQ